MLSMIHSLIGLTYQQGVKQINVCYKHPELLKQAREKCISNRDGGSGSSEVVRSERRNKNVRMEEKKSEEISFSLDSLGDSETVLGGLDSGGGTGGR